MDYIKNWIIDSYNNTKLSCKSCLFITGNSGIGKTHLVNTICAELDFFIIDFLIQMLEIFYVQYHRSLPFD